MHNDHEKEFWELIDLLIAEHEIIIDRPKGSTHPVYKNNIYPLDYGYLKDTSSSDGDGIDVWVGTSGTGRADAVITSVDIRKKDSEIKILISCTEQEIEQIYNKHNSTSDMKGLLNIRT